nr:MAG TPA: hypothetical protein [Caudoviricetes sp.]
MIWIQFNKKVHEKCIFFVLNVDFLMFYVLY